ncbi:MAG: tetratricopeptide repeat protein, partial [Rhodospirillaceae bacterium]|nr:tetratricopeptide repeat protein [Rhodospirillaceae bacterium]
MPSAPPCNHCGCRDDNKHATGVRHAQGRRRSQDPSRDSRHRQRRRAGAGPGPAGHGPQRPRRAGGRHRRLHAGGADRLGRALRLSGTGRGLPGPGDYEEALADLNDAVWLAPDYAPAYLNRGVVLQLLGRDDEARADFDRTIRLDPSLPEAYCNRAGIHADRGRLEAALRDCAKALELRPDFADAHGGRGCVLARLGRLEPALADLDQAVALGGGTAQVYATRAVIHARSGRYGSAIEGWSRAIDLDPSEAQSYGDLAWVLATTDAPGGRDGARAVALAEKAVALDPDNPLMRDALAAAYAEAGRFDEALRTQQEVVAMLRAQGPAGLMGELKRRLAA